MPARLFLTGFRLAWLMLAISVTTALGDDLRAVIKIDPPSVEVGETTELQLQVIGSRGAGKVPEIKVDGLDIQYAGHSSSYSMGIENGRFTTTNVSAYSYQVTPRRSGNFTIPELTIEADGRTLRTEPVSLQVQGGGGPNGGAPAPGALDTQGRAEIALGKTSAYLGESVPVELRLLIDSRIMSELNAAPTFEGEGFTTPRLTKPKVEQARRDERDYTVDVFRTTVTPSRAGKVSIGPAEFNFLAQVPRAQRNRPRSPFNDDFFERMFNDPRSGFGVTRQYKAIAEAPVLDVKPLPLAGQPKGFTGAVGQFRISAEGSPLQVKVGDPITMKVTVSGMGNFDRVNAPALAESAGWRTYPPTESSHAEDEAGLRFSKTFEVAVIPEAKQTHLPVFEFAYFDPETAKYSVLKTRLEPLTVEGDAPARPATPAPASTFGVPAATPAPPAPPSDILGLRYDFGTARSLRPLHEERGFLLAQAAPFAVMLGWLFLSLRRPDRRAQQLARWRRERAELAAQLRRERDRQAFYDTAGRVLRLDAALRSGHSPETIDVAEIHRSLPANDELSRAIDEIFEARAATLYAGGGGGEAGALAAPDRARLLGTLGQIPRA